MIFAMGEYSMTKWRAACVIRAGASQHEPFCDASLIGSLVQAHGARSQNARYRRAFNLMKFPPGDGDSMDVELRLNFHHGGNGLGWPLAAAGNALSTWLSVSLSFFISGSTTKWQR